MSEFVSKPRACQSFSVPSAAVEDMINLSASSNSRLIDRIHCIDRIDLCGAGRGSELSARSKPAPLAGRAGNQAQFTSGATICDIFARDARRARDMAGGPTDGVEHFRGSAAGRAFALQCPGVA